MNDRVVMHLSNMWRERPQAWTNFYNKENLQRYLSKMYFTLNVNRVNSKLKKYNAVYEYDRTEARVIFDTEKDLVWFLLKWS